MTTFKLPLFTIAGLRKEVIELAVNLEKWLHFTMR